MGNLDVNSITVKIIINWKSECNLNKIYTLLFIFNILSFNKNAVYYQKCYPLI